MRHLITECLIQRHASIQSHIPEGTNWNGDFNKTEPSNTTTLRPAAVLIPLVERKEGLTIILTQRTAHLHNHGGQICFPGGMRDAQDSSPIATALRETEEEIGLQSDFVEVAGYLDVYETITNFLITPVVGFVKLGFNLKLDTFEVADVFEVPLRFVLNPENHQRQSVIYQGKERFYYVFNYQNRVIWGATAGILVNLHERFQNKWLGKNFVT